MKYCPAPRCDKGRVIISETLAFIIVHKLNLRISLYIYESGDWFWCQYGAMLVFVPLLLSLRRRGSRAHIMCAASWVDAEVHERVRDSTFTALLTAQIHQYLSFPYNYQANWILANTRKCPNCNTRIEKNQGCNHMTCRLCKHEFCWTCMGERYYAA